MFNEHTVRGAGQNFFYKAKVDFVFPCSLCMKKLNIVSVAKSKPESSGCCLVGIAKFLKF